MVQSIFLQMDYKIVEYLYQLYTFSFLVTEVKFIGENLQECKKEILKIYLCQTIGLLQSGLKIIRYQKTQINGNCLWQHSASLIHKSVVTN